MLEDLTTYKCGTLTLDGGNSSDSEVLISSMYITRRFLKLLVELIKKAAMLVLTPEEMSCIKDGELSILTQSADKKSRD